MNAEPHDRILTAAESAAIAASIEILYESRRFLARLGCSHLTGCLSAPRLTGHAKALQGLLDRDSAPEG